VLVWVTRDEPEGGPLSTALRDAGLGVVHEPALERRVVSGARDEIAALGADDWLVLTSVFAVRAIAPPGALRCRIAVVGEKTKAAAESRGLRIEYVSAGGTASDLFQEISGRAAGHTICYPRSSEARVPDLGAGVTLVSPVAYETRRRAWRRDVVDDVDVIAVTSPSAVTAVGALAKKYASLGPTTSAALRDLGVEPWIEAPVKSFDSLARAIADHAERSRNHSA